MLIADVLKLQEVFTAQVKCSFSLDKSKFASSNGIFLGIMRIK